MKRITILSLILTTACGADKIIVPPAPIPTKVEITTASAVFTKTTDVDSIRIHLKNSGESGNYQVELLGSSPDGSNAKFARTEAIVARKGLDSAFVYTVNGFSYVTQTLAVKIYTQDSTKKYIQTSCAILRTGGICP